MIFRLILIGKAIEYIPHFVFTFEEMGRAGIGRGRGRYRIERVFCLNGKLNEERLQFYDGEALTFRNNVAVRNFSHHIQEEAEELWSKSKNGKLEILLRFLTPTRMKSDNKLTSEVTFEVLLKALLRRISMLSNLHCGQALPLEFFRILAGEDSQLITARSRLHWHDWERYSERQSMRMKMGGFRGEISFAGSLRQSLPFLLLGKYIHIGKGTAFGLGKYEIKVVE